MSFKVYNAYHLKDPNSLWVVLRKINKQAQENVRQKLKDFWRTLMVNLQEDSDKFKQELSKNDNNYALTRLFIVDDLMRQEVVKQATSMQRNHFDVSVSVSLFELNGQYYLRGFCDRGSCLGGSLDFLNDMSELEDYYYQNSTDKPEEISDEEWKKRVEIWDSIYSDHGFTTCQLHMDICDWEIYALKFSPFLDFYKEILEKKDGEQLSKAPTVS